MKIFALLCAVLALAITQASAAEPAVSHGQLTDSQLTDMGLASMQLLSDDEGQSVRGQGTFANVWGGSTARWGNQSSSNNYAAGSSWLGKSSGAVGSSTSYAGRFQFNGFFGR